MHMVCVTKGLNCNGMHLAANTTTVKHFWRVTIDNLLSGARKMLTGRVTHQCQLQLSNTRNT